MSRSLLGCIFLVSIAVVWVSLDFAAAFVAFWFGAVGWSIGRTWPRDPSEIN